MKLHHTTARMTLIAGMYLFFASSAFSATDNATLTVGKTTLPSPPAPCTTVFAGYGAGVGSYSPTGLTGGYTLTALMDHGCSAPTQATLNITGFAAGPGKLWLTSVTCNGVTRQASAATSYSYNSSSGTAVWSWAGVFGFNALSIGTNVSCSITHA